MHRGPSSNPQQSPYQKPSMVLHACKPSAVGEETGGLPELLAASLASGSGRDLYQQRQSIPVALWPLYVHKDMHTGHTHLNIHVCIYCTYPHPQYTPKINNNNNNKPDNITVLLIAEFPDPQGYITTAVRKQF